MDSVAAGLAYRPSLALFCIAVFKLSFTDNECSGMEERSSISIEVQGLLTLTHRLLLPRVPQLDRLVPRAGDREAYLRAELHTADRVVMTAQPRLLAGVEVHVQERAVQASAERVTRVSEAAVQHCVLRKTNSSTNSLTHSLPSSSWRNSLDGSSWPSAGSVAHCKASRHYPTRNREETEKKDWGKTPHT